MTTGELDDQKLRAILRDPSAPYGYLAGGGKTRVALVRVLVAFVQERAAVENRTAVERRASISSSLTSAAEGRGC